ncbi:MAG TPA: AsmA family protein [Candidatus Acidoferrum sp.]|nr:AsmA family protein [Candidatus Acidoferrum sp.]
MYRARKWRRLALSIATLLIAAQVGASFLARARGIHKYLVAHLERAFGRTVEVRHFNIFLLPGPMLDAEQVSIGEDPAFGSEYFLRAEHLTAGLRWSGLLRGHFEFGTLSLSRPSLILVRNDEGQWNLERWLPPAKSTLGAGSRFYGPRPQQTPSNRLQKIDIDDGRINFKTGDEKLPFAFLGVSGSVEQVSSGRWRLQLEAQPWRSGVTLQSTGTILVRGDVAGTSARLQPAEVHVHWGKVSLADLFRLLRGQDYGVRGVFALDGTATSGASDRLASADMQPGDWTFSAQARAAQIHRWDLTERPDNPAANVNLDGRWNVGMRNVSAERVVVETARSNLRGSARFALHAAPAWEIRLDSAGIQAADLLEWYRAFDPNVNNAIVAQQFFTGAITLRGWPLEIDEAAFSSTGGEIKVPGLDAPLRIGAFQGGRQRASLNVAPVRISYAVHEGSEAATAATIAKRRSAAESNGAVDIGFTHDFIKRAGGLSIDGRIDNVEDVLKIMSALGRPMNRGWELTGPVSAALHYQWDNTAATRAWSGHVDVSKTALQVAGLNQPLRLNKARLDWNDGLRSASLTDVEGFGATWSGQLAQAGVADVDGGSKWNFALHANHLDATALDRWMGPRARPGWLQRLLSSLLGASAANPAASELLRRVNAEGELRVDEFTLERIKFGQVRASGALHDLHLELRQAEARCAGGRLRAKMRAAFLPRPSYDVTAELDRVDLQQVPAPGNLPERFAGLASGTVHLTTQGVGRDELLQHLVGKGDLKLRDLEFRGWDVNASMAEGAPHEGASRWASGQGTFLVHDRGIIFPGLRLDAGSEMTLLKGTLSFVQDSDLTLQTLIDDQTGAGLPEVGYVLKISGPLDVPKISIERLVARRPAD